MLLPAAPAAQQSAGANTGPKKSAASTIPQSNTGVSSTNIQIAQPSTNAGVTQTNTNQNNRLTRLEESTSSLNAFSASQLTKDSTLQLYTASIDTKFSTYCKAIVWNGQKSLGKKITREKSVRNGVVSLSEFDHFL